MPDVPAGDDGHGAGERDRDAGEATAVERLTDERREEDGQHGIEGDEQGGVRRRRARERDEEQPGIEHPAADDHPRQRARRGAEAARGTLPDRERQQDRRRDGVAPRGDGKRCHLAERELPGDEARRPADRGEPETRVGERPRARVGRRRHARG